MPSERRTSGRARAMAKYTETGDSTDDEQMDLEDKTSETEPMDVE